jgi:hypothetical protein
MKNTLTILPWIIIILMLAYINQCTSLGHQVPEIIYRDSIQIRDSISSPILITGQTVYLPEPYEVIVYEPLTWDTLTNEHLSYLEWMKIKKYNLPISDSNQNLNINLEIQYNAIKKWSYSGTYFEKWKIKNITKNETFKPKNSLSVGCILSGNKEKSFGVSPSIIFETKKHTQFLAGYDIINKTFSTGILIKL